MNQLSDKTKIRNLIFLCSMVYFTSYVSRINLSAILVAIVDSGFAPKTVVALALTICSVTYGAGQIISGYLGDRFRPQNVIFSGFLITGCMNLGVFLLQNSKLLPAIWAVNGFAQALMWPPLVAIMTKHFRPADYQRACVRVSWGSSFATIAVYLFSPLIIHFTSFRYVFLISSVAAFVMGFSWKVIYAKQYQADSVTEVVEKKKAEPAQQAERSFGRLAIMMLISSMGIIILQGSLRDGVSNWMPSFISETFRLDSSVSILSGVLLPVFSLLCHQAAYSIYHKFLKNELVCAGVIFSAGFLAAALLSVFHESNVFFSVFLLALLTGSMHGVNLMMTCMVPPCFAKYGHISLISGALNSCTYVGSAVSTYAIAVFSDKFGWNSTIILWAGIALLGTVLCLALSGKWKQFTNK